MSLASAHDADTVAARAVALERFLQSCFQHQLIFASNALLQFLDLPLRLGNPQQRGAFIVQYDRSPDSAQYGNVPRPVLFRRNEPILVLVRVRAAALTPLDVRIRRGDERLVFPYQLPLILGFDFSGEVVAVGAAVKDFRVGDAVFGRLDDRCIGALAEYALVAAPLLAAKPANVSHEEAATFPSLAMTTHQALVDEAKLQRGESLFVNGGGTGLGSFALQYATAVLGAQVTVACAAASIERCKQLGATTVVDETDEPAVSGVRGLDVAIDTTGHSDTALWTVKSGGRFISTSLADKSGDALKRHSVLSVPRYVRWLASANNGLTMAQAAARRIRYTTVLPRAAGDVMRSVATAIGEGKLKPFIDRVYRLEQIGEAMAYLDKGNVQGTVVIDVTPTADEERRRSLSPQPLPPARRRSATQPATTRPRTAMSTQTTMMKKTATRATIDWRSELSDFSRHNRRRKLAAVGSKLEIEQCKWL
jgi:NADPH:quinone reductase-like Zn-dependent oxidoreductase